MFRLLRGFWRWRDGWSVQIVLSCWLWLILRLVVILIVLLRLGSMRRAGKMLSELIKRKMQPKGTRLINLSTFIHLSNSKQMSDFPRECPDLVFVLADRLSD